MAPLAGHMTFLATREGRGRSAKSIGGDVSAAARAAGVQKSAHGLRKSRCAFNADGGATATQIASWTGHESLSEVTHYTKSADLAPLHQPGRARGFGVAFRQPGKERLKRGAGGLRLNRGGEKRSQDQGAHGQDSGVGV